MGSKAIGVNHRNLSAQIIAHFVFLLSGFALRAGFFTGFDAQGVQVLSDKLKQNEGSSVAMVLDGPSGCGKTTILHLISGLLHADSGSIIFAGQELLGLDNKSRARWRSQNIGYILQRLNLLEELSRSSQSMLSMITIGM